jgi:hypothetical protein
MKKNKAAARASTATPATAMPAMAPFERPEFALAVLATAVALAVDVVELEAGVELVAEAEALGRELGVPSGGNGSPGLSMYAESFAS